MKLIKKIDKSDMIFRQYDDLLGNNINHFKRKFDLESVKNIKNRLEELDDLNRLLRIGVVGRVKAGKSTLINCLLFDGKSILPEAATPMTAALTKLSYGETLKATVEFFSQEDIKNIKTDYDEYNYQFDQIEKNQFELLKQKRINKNPNETYDLNELKIKAKKKASRELKGNVKLSASHEQYTMIINSEVDISSLDKEKQLYCSNLDELNKQLNEYVSASGKYVPMTKSVSIEFPEELLKSIELVDTPGINDPVQSREERTRSELQNCDVIIMVSPAGSFINSADMDLMERIISVDGVKDILVVISQVDNMLFSDEYEKNDRNLTKVIDSSTKKLSKQLKDTLVNLKQNCPEIGDVFDGLIKSENRVIHSSGRCKIMDEKIKNDVLLTPDEVVTWNNLREHYPDNFSSDDLNATSKNMNYLANINETNIILDTIRQRKQEIIGKRREEYLEAKTKLVKEYLEAVLKFVENERNMLNSSDINELNQNLIKYSTLVKHNPLRINKKFQIIIYNSLENLDSKLELEIRSYSKNMNLAIEEGTGNESKKGDIRDGFFNKIANKLWDGGREHKKRVSNINTDAVNRSLRKYLGELIRKVNKFSNIHINELVGSLPNQVLELIRDHINDGDIDMDSMEHIVDVIVYSLKFDAINHEAIELINQGRIEGDEIDQYISTLHAHSDNQLKSIRNAMKSYVENLKNYLEGKEIGNLIFDSYKEKIDDTKRKIETKKMTMSRYAQLIEEIGEV